MLVPPPIRHGRAELFKSINGGSSWSKVTDTLPDRFPMEMVLDPLKDDTIYVVFGGYGLSSHVFRSLNAGASWQAIGTGLPDVPTNCMLIDPLNTQHIYVGTDVGVFVSTNWGSTWSAHCSGLARCLSGDGPVLFSCQPQVACGFSWQWCWEANMLHGTSLPVTLGRFLGEK